ncbi:acetyltransferase, GNAT family protein [gamma proteobacterium IMCC1989]|nr:acetyltransferase, GNAT family protein [gamma proteobacterium IMCC1989]
MPLDIEIREIPLDDRLLGIRQTVLWPDKALSSLRVAGDENALHFGCFLGRKLSENKLVGVASIYITQHTARLRKFATLADYQHQGIGSTLLSYIVDVIGTKDVSYFWCDARASATLFYEKFGMQKEGDIFYKSTIPYYRMSKEISNTYSAS